MDNNSNYFYISGLISFSLFTLFLLLFLFMLLQPSKINSFALKKDNFISISLEVPKVESLTKKQNKKTPQLQEAVEAPKKSVDVNNLFSDVWTKKITPKKITPKKVDNKRYLEIQKKIQTTKANEVKSLSEAVNDLENVKRNKKSDASSTAEEVNEYLAKIQAIVYQHFHVPPNSEGNSVKTLIELNAFGKVLDFRVLNYSTNSALNAEADKIKSRLMHVTFPINPEHKSSKTIVILIPEE